MLDEITLAQLVEWQFYSQLEPWDDVRDDIRTAQIVQALVNLNRDSKKHPKPFPIADFILRFGEADEDVEPEPAPEQTWETQMQVARLIAESFGGVQ